MNFKNIFCIFLIYQNTICKPFITKNNIITYKNNIIIYKNNYYNKLHVSQYSNLIQNNRIYFKSITKNIKKKTKSFLKYSMYIIIKFFFWIYFKEFFFKII